jgi:hypothetical protein
VPGPRYDLRKPPDATCAWCGAPFRRRAARLKCCSHSCGQKLRYKRPPTPCSVCGEPVKKTANRTCSRSCANEARAMSVAARMAARHEGEERREREARKF